MSERVEGTYRLDGIIEGPLPASPDAAERLNDWARTSTTHGLPFNVETDGGSFNALAVDTALPVSALPQDLENAVTDQLDELLRCFPPTERAALVSTVRSHEYRRGEEVQTLYAVTPTGKIETQQRTVEIATTAPPQPIALKERLKLGAIGLLIAGAIFAISSIWIPYGRLYRQAVHNTIPLKAEHIEVRYSSLQPYFTVTNQQVVHGNRGLKLTLSRTAGYLDAAKSTEDSTLTTQPVHHRLAAEAIVRGYINAEWFDEENRFIANHLTRIRPLTERESIEVVIPVPRDIRPSRLVLTY